MPKFADDGRTPPRRTWVPWIIDADEIGGAPVEQGMSPAASDVLTWTGTEWSPAPAAGGGAPLTASYVTVALDPTLPNERALAVSAPATLTDGGAGASITIGVQTFGAAQSGAVPASGGGSTNYLRADGTWAAPPGTGVTSVGAAAPITTTGGLTPTIGVDDFTAGARGTVPASGGGTSNFLRADVTWAAPPDGCGVYTWGAASVQSTTATRYLVPGFSTGTAPTSPVVMSVPFAGVVRNLFVRHQTPAGNGNAIVYTVRINGVASALAVSLASTSASGSDTVDSPAVVAGDYVDIIVTKAASIASSPTNCVATFEIARS